VPPSFARLMGTPVGGYVCSNASLANADYLDIHNEARVAVGSPLMTWDSDAAAAAQAWADSLKKNSNCGGNIQDSREPLRPEPGPERSPSWVLQQPGCCHILAWDGGQLLAGSLRLDQELGVWRRGLAQLRDLHASRLAVLYKGQIQYRTVLYCTAL